MRNWINYAQNIQKIARDSSLLEKKAAAKEIFGSNLRLASRALAGEPQNQWAALCAAREMASKKSESLILVPPPGFEPRFRRSKRRMISISPWGLILTIK